MFSCHNHSHPRSFAPPPPSSSPPPPPRSNLFLSAYQTLHNFSHSSSRCHKSRSASQSKQLAWTKSD
eukprot:766741-Hanusia_phi.AAC.4